MLNVHYLVSLVFVRYQIIDSKFKIFCFKQKQDFKMALRKYRKALRYSDVCWEKEEIDEGKHIFALIIVVFYMDICT